MVSFLACIRRRFLVLGRTWGCKEVTGMKLRNLIIGSSMLLSLTAVSYSQGIPKFEAAADFSYINFQPQISKVTSQNLNGGGGSFVYNIVPYFAVRADFQGYGMGTGWNKALANAGYGTFSVTGNMFTYMFGPQFKRPEGRFLWHGNVLFGAMHSNGYGTLIRQLCVSISGCVVSANNSNNGFAMQFGGGVDIPVGDHIQIRPVEADFLLTHFGYQNWGAYQKNFKYVGGINFVFARPWPKSL